MHERDTVFRDRLIALVSGLKGADRQDIPLRKLVGTYANRLAREAGVRDWSDLKERADGPTYDSLLNLFQKQSEAASKSGDPKTVRAFEILGLSLIARRQAQADLVPGVSLVDKFIKDCSVGVRRSGVVSIPVKSAKH